jgi:hypothetical protein
MRDRDYRNRKNGNQSQVIKANLSKEQENNGAGKQCSLQTRMRNGINPSRNQSISDTDTNTDIHNSHAFTPHHITSQPVPNNG